MYFGVFGPKKSCSKTRITASYDGDVTCKTKTMAGVHWQEPLLPDGGCCFCGTAAMLMSAIADTSIKTSSFSRPL